MTTFTAPIKKADKAAGSVSERLVAAAKPREYNVIEQAIIALSGVCDGAHSRDGQGFNGTDSQFGKSLAVQLTTSRRGLTYKQAVSAAKILKKYSKQLKKMGYDAPTDQDFQALYSKERIVVINGEIAVYRERWTSENIYLFEGVENVRFVPAENSYRCNLSYAPMIWDAIRERKDEDFYLSDDFLCNVIDCGF